MENKKFKLLFLLAIFVVAGAYFGYQFFQTSRLFDNATLGNAYIYKINKAGIKTGNIVIFFYFDAEGKKIYAREDSNLELAVQSKLLNRYFPLIYDKSNPKQCLLLTAQAQWSRIGLSMPDSVLWIKHYYP